MNNTINVNGMISYYNSFIKSITSQTSVNKGSKINSEIVNGEKDSFISTLSSKVETADAVEEATAVSTKDMTLEEYKNYIHDKISELPFCADAMNDSYSIDISDDGFRAMQKDPEYEKWVLNEMKTVFETPYPSWARAIRKNRYCVIHFGATKEESYGMSWGNSYQNGTGGKVWEAQSKGSFWTKRAEQKKIQDRIDKKAAEKKELEEKWLQEAAEKRQAYTDFLNGDKVFKTNNISEINDFFQMPSNPKVAGILSAYEAGTFPGGGLI